MTDVVALEVAEKEFEKFLEAMDLSADTSKLEEADRKGFESNRDIFLRAVCRGSLHVDEKGQPVFKPSEGESITFYEPTGATALAMDQIKKGHDVQRLYASLAEMTRTPSKRYALMKQRDLKVCEAVFVLFLALK